MTAPTLPVTPAASAAGAGPFTITLAAGLTLLNANDRLHHRRKAERTAVLRSKAREAVSENPGLVNALAAAKPGPLFQRVHVLGILHPDRNDRRDPANWYPSFKAAIDGLVDAGLLEDDDHTHVVGPDMRLGTKVKGGQLVLVVSGLAPGEDPLGYEAVTS